MKIFFIAKENILQCKSFFIVHKLYIDLLFVEKYAHTVVVGIVMSVLLHFYVSPLNNLSQVRLVQNT